MLIDNTINDRLLGCYLQRPELTLDSKYPIDKDEWGILFQKIFEASGGCFLCHPQSELLVCWRWRGQSQHAAADHRKADSENCPLWISVRPDQELH